MSPDPSLRGVVTSPYFPTVLNEAVQRLRGSEIGAARDPLVRGFVDDLAFGWPDPTHAYHNHANVLIALEAVVELHRPIAVGRIITAIEKLAKTGQPDPVRFGGALSLRVREAGEHVDDATKAILRIWLVGETSANKGRAVKRAMEINWWRESALEAMDTLTADQISVVTDPPVEMVSKAAELYAGAKNWDEANLLASKIANPLADRFSREDIITVLDASHNGADLRGSHGFREYIDLLYDKNIIEDAQLEELLDEHNLAAYKRADQVEEG